MERTAGEPNKPDANENAAVVDDVPTVRDLLDYQDEATTEEEANQYWSHINAEADRWRKQVVDYIGPWGYVGAGGLFFAGSYVGYRRTLEKDVKVSRSAAMLAAKALGASTLLTTTIAAFSVWSISYAWNVKTIPEFNDKLKEHLPGVSRKMESVLQKVGLSLPKPDTMEATPGEIEAIDEAWDQARREVWQEEPMDEKELAAYNNNNKQAQQQQQPPAKRPWRPWFIRIFQS